MAKILDTYAKTWGGKKIRCRSFNDVLSVVQAHVPGATKEGSTGWNYSWWYYDNLIAHSWSRDGNVWFVRFHPTVKNPDQT